MQRQGIMYAVEGAEYPGEVYHRIIEPGSLEDRYRMGEITEEEYEEIFMREIEKWGREHPDK